MKKIFIYILVFLFLFSVYKDLDGGSLQNRLETLTENASITNYKAVYVKVQHGDTILSIVEDINEKTMQIQDINQILEDFRLLNPNVNTDQLKVGHFYYFPSY
jgi:hypothetical protein